MTSARPADWERHATWVMAMVAAHLHASGRRSLGPALLAVFPLVLGLGLYNPWAHRFDYGRWSGEVPPSSAPAFEFHDPDGNLVNNASLAGKVVLLGLDKTNAG